MDAGLLISFYAIANSLGNALMWLWVVLFLAFGIAQVYFLWVRPSPA